MTPFKKLSTIEIAYKFVCNTKLSQKAGTKQYKKSTWSIYYKMHTC